MELFKNIFKNENLISLEIYLYLHHPNPLKFLYPLDFYLDILILVFWLPIYL